MHAADMNVDGVFVHCSTVPSRPRVLSSTFLLRDALRHGERCAARSIELAAPFCSTVLVSIEALRFCPFIAPPPTPGVRQGGGRGALRLAHIQWGPVCRGTSPFAHGPCARQPAAPCCTRRSAVRWRWRDLFPACEPAFLQATLDATVAAAAIAWAFPLFKARSRPSPQASPPRAFTSRLLPPNRTKITPSRAPSRLRLTRTRSANPQACGRVLLQGMPDDLHSAVLDRCLRDVGTVPDVRAVECPRFWALEPGKLVGASCVLPTLK